MKNANKTALITGISSGIGLALTKKLLAEGYHVIGTTRTGLLNELAHPVLQVIALDITSEASIQQAVDQLATLTDGLDLLINNAGAGSDLGTLVPERATFTHTLDTNLTGTVFFTESLLPYLKTGSQIIFVSSHMGLFHRAAPDSPAYRISKAALNMYAAILAPRLANRHIRVTPMHPGWVQTKMGGDQAPLTVEQAADGLYRGILTNTETGKFWDATADEVVAY